jgi:hypothetical protein
MRLPARPARSADSRIDRVRMIDEIVPGIERGGPPALLHPYRLCGSSRVQLGAGPMIAWAS